VHGIVPPLETLHEPVGATPSQNWTTMPMGVGGGGEAKEASGAQ